MSETGENMTNPQTLDLDFRTNRLLAALPSEDYERLLPSLQVIAAQPYDVLIQPNTPFEYVYFPLRGVTSFLVVMNDSIMGEVGTVGNEGMVGINLLFGSETTTTRVICQVAGETLRLPVEVLKTELSQNSALVPVLQNYAQTWMATLTQHAACNILHPLNERCAYWLLLTHDRVGADQFALTQEFLGLMLGVRRAAINNVMQMLHQAGYIRYRRGVIQVIDRAGLESASCECYGVITAEYERMLG
jgi:CRP-like cAMP-binding protein